MWDDLARRYLKMHKHFHWILVCSHPQEYEITRKSLVLAESQFEDYFADIQSFKISFNSRVVSFQIATSSPIICPSCRPFQCSFVGKEKKLLTPKRRTSTNMELKQLENGFFIAFFKMDSYAMHMYDKNFHITIFPNQCRIDGKISERWALISIFDVAHNLSHILYGTAIQENISFHRI